MKPEGWKTKPSKLHLGLIPQGQECPFRGQCIQAQTGQCNHKGKDHTCSFSCGTARGFDLIQQSGG